jgi:hypothetical protein
MGEPDNIVLQHLHAIRAQLDTIGKRQLETLQRMRSMAAQLTGLSIRIGQIDGRLGRVERRLELIARRVCME